MPSTSNPEFNDKTEGAQVAHASSSVIRGKTVLITGVNRGGLAFTTADALASHSPKCFIFAGRSTQKVLECIDTLKERFPDIDYRTLQIDLSSQESVRRAAAEALSWTGIPSIDILANNAGVMNLPDL